MEQISVLHLKNITNVWLQVLDFYKKEIYTLKDRLTTLTSKNTPRYLPNQVERFENEFKLQINKIEQLGNAIKSDATNIGEQLDHSNDGNLEFSVLSKYYQLKEQFIKEEKAFKEVSYEFNEFESDYMTEVMSSQEREKQETMMKISA